MPIFGSNPPATDTKYISIYERSAPRSSKLCPESECTETIGFESMSLKSADNFSDGIELSDLDLITTEENAIANERRRRTTTKKKDPEERRKRINFPPVLTILNGTNGRPRFDFAKQSTADGRMTMRMVAREGKEIVRCFRGDGRLKIELIDSESDGEDCFDDCGGCCESCGGYGGEEE